MLDGMYFTTISISTCIRSQLMMKLLGAMTWSGRLMASRSQCLEVCYHLLTFLAQIVKHISRNRLRPSVALTTTFACWILTVTATISETPAGFSAKRTTAFIVFRAAFRACRSA